MSLTGEERGLKQAWQRVALGVALAMTIGCGADAEDNDAEDNDEPSTLTAAEAHAELTVFTARYFCKAAFTCPEWGYPLSALLVGLFGNQAACEAGWAELGGDERDEFLAAIAADRIRFDGDLARACLDATGAVLEGVCSGASLDDLTEVCEGIFVGLVAEGGNCALSDACEGEARCDTANSDECYGQCTIDPNACVGCTRDQYCDTDAEPSSCVDRKPSGAPCDHSGQCVDRTLCMNGVCGAPFANLLSAGAECIPGASDGGICEPGLICMAAEEDFQWVCGAARVRGDACTTTFDCAMGLACHIAPMTRGGTCGDRLALGESCHTSFDCESAACEADTCVERGACVVP